MFKRLIASLICFAFIFSNIQFAAAQDFSINQLPVPGTMVEVSSPFAPLAFKGLIVNPQKPLEFEFIVDTGRGAQDTASIKDQANQLVKYFLAGLTIPEGDLWVNLSPYEKNRMVPEALGQTDLGRDLLAQDYVLKQLTASLIYPEKDLGKEFWSRVYSKAQQQFGTTNVPVNTFNKVWILPDQAQVYENLNNANLSPNEAIGPFAAYVTKATLKVMMDEDYLALQKHMAQHNGTDSLGANIVRQIILPEIEKEVNTGKNFAPLRQIYQALILAKWYKETIQNGLLNAIYTDKNKIAGVNLTDPAVKEQIYERYLKAYKKGAFNYIKEDPTPDGQVVPRKYFSGGIPMVIPLKENGTLHDVEDQKHDGAMMGLTIVLFKDSAMLVPQAVIEQGLRLASIKENNPIERIRPDVYWQFEKFLGPWQEAMETLRKNNLNNMADMLGDLLLVIMPKLIEAQKESPIQHIAHVVNFAVQIGLDELGKGNITQEEFKVLVIAALFHDSGLSEAVGRKIVESEIDSTEGIAQQKLIKEAIAGRREHMDIGVRLAIDTLREYQKKNPVKLKSEEIAEIAHIIAHHDDMKIPNLFNRKEFASPEERKAAQAKYLLDPKDWLMQLHWEADTLWMDCPDGIEVDMRRTKKNGGVPKKPLSQFFYNINQHRKSVKVFRDILDKKIYDTYGFKEGLIYRSAKAYEIFDQYRQKNLEDLKNEILSIEAGVNGQPGPGSPRDLLINHLLGRVKTGTVQFSDKLVNILKEDGTVAGVMDESLSKELNYKFTDAAMLTFSGILSKALQLFNGKKVTLNPEDTKNLITRDITWDPKRGTWIGLGEGEEVVQVVSGTQFFKIARVRKKNPAGPQAPKATDKAVLAANPQDLGGIDFNQINVKRHGKTVNVQFDQAQLSALEQGGFEGFSFKIENIARISSPIQLLETALNITRAAR